MRGLTAVRTPFARLNWSGWHAYAAIEVLNALGILFLKFDKSFDDSKGILSKSINLLFDLRDTFHSIDKSFTLIDYN